MSVLRGSNWKWNKPHQGSLFTPMQRGYVIYPVIFFCVLVLKKMVWIWCPWSRTAFSLANSPSLTVMWVWGETVLVRLHSSQHHVNLCWRIFSWWQKKMEKWADSRRGAGLFLVRTQQCVKTLIVLWDYSKVGLIKYFFSWHNREIVKGKSLRAL